MWNATNGITGIGYEGETLDSFVRKLTAWKVSTLVDVRLNAISRKRGFAKTALSEGLRANGIEYVHLPALGNPKDNRGGYGESQGEAAKHARDVYLARLESEAALISMDALVDLAQSGRVAVLCFEANERHCHRQQVIEVAVEQLNSLLAV